MQDKEIKSLKEQASALGKHLLTKHGVTLGHSELLEALAAMNNKADWNTLCASEPKKKKSAMPADKTSSLPAEELLKLALDKGLTFGTITTAVAARQDAKEQAYASYARDHLVSEGDLEFDDPGCVVSASDDGAYVMGWKWVYRSAIRGKIDLTKLPALVEEGYEDILNALTPQDEKVEEPSVKWEQHPNGKLSLVLRDGEGTVLVSIAEDDPTLVIDHYSPSQEDQDDLEEMHLDEDDTDFVEVRAQGWELRLYSERY